MRKRKNRLRIRRGIKSTILLMVLLIILSSCSIIDKVTKKEASLEHGFELVVVNKDNYVSKKLIPDDLITLKNGIQVDSRIINPLQNMIDDMRAQGLDPTVTSGFRTNEIQKKYYEDGVKARIQKGMSEEEAKVSAAESIAKPGTSEHEIGLAVDINSLSADNTHVYKWLENNSYKYGFILRYHSMKTNFTGVIYEPWHYRYVGKEHSEKIFQSGLCLEEYVEKLK